MAAISSPSDALSEPLRPQNPANGAPLAAVACSTPAEIEGSISRAQAAQAAWWRRGIDGRIAALEGFARRLADPAFEARLSRQISEEMGKPIREARSEVRNVGRRLEAFGERARIALADEISREGGIEVRVRQAPLGVVAVIAPWNYPVATPTNLILSALLVGNTAVFKPSELAPHTGALLHAALEEALPEGVCGLVQGRGEVGAALVAGDVQLIAFTGSIATGQAIMRAASFGVKRLVLELGGKDPMIVLPGADLEAAASYAAIESVRNSGQACVSVERVIVARSLAEPFAARVATLVKGMLVGDPLDEHTDLGPLASQAQRAHVLAQLEDARAKGATFLVEGRASAAGFFLEPSVVLGVTAEMLLAREETFGPVVSIEIAESAEHALALANGTIYGLGASIWGAPGPALDALAERIEAGMVGINRGLSTAAGGPWVGWKRSGLGFTRSVAGMRSFLQPQGLAKNVPRE
jgi:acyl-CoA reductase-like NAD-dependent aldehyde dehydrogenase